MIFLSKFLYSISFFLVLYALIPIVAEIRSRLKPNRENPEQVFEFQKKVRFIRQTALWVSVVFISLAFVVKLNIIVSIIVCIPLGIFGPKFFEKREKKLREENFDKALVESLTSLRNSLKAGLTLQQAIEVSLQNCPMAFVEQMQQTLKEYRLGVSIDQALDNVRKRISTPQSNISFGALVIGRKLGGPLPDILERIASTIRERERVEGRLQALTAQGRAQGFILCSAPVMFGVGTAIFSPEKMALMTGTTIGQVLLIMAIILECIGIYITWRILQLDV